MNHKNHLKNTDEFSGTNVLIMFSIVLNNNSCQTKVDDIFDQEIYDNYATCILDAKHEQVNVTDLAANQ